MPVLRDVDLYEPAFLALSRTATPKVSGRADRFCSAITATQPELWTVETDGGPFSESPSCQVDDAVLGRAGSAHRHLAGEQVGAELILLDTAIASANPVLADDVRDHGVLPKSLSCDVSELLRAGHSTFSWKEG
jgi:hypothetical protein